MSIAPIFEVSPTPGGGGRFAARTPSSPPRASLSRKVLRMSDESELRLIWVRHVRKNLRHEMSELRESEHSLLGVVGESNDE